MLTPLRHHEYQMKYCKREKGLSTGFLFISSLGKGLPSLKFLHPRGRDEKDVLQTLGKGSLPTACLCDFKVSSGASLSVAWGSPLLPQATPHSLPWLCNAALCWPQLAVRGRV